MRRSGSYWARLLLLTLCCAGAASAQEPSATKAKVQFVDVQPGVKLEVLDWGGSGRPLVFLAGLGNTAHVFEDFAPRFTDHFHVYGITRRGFGASSRPAPTVENYSADRLGDDVVTVVHALHLDRPVLVGHSIAGEELSDVADRYPDKIGGLIYLDAAFGPGYYTHGSDDWVTAMAALWGRLEALRKGAELNAAFAQQMQAEAADFSRDAQLLTARMAERPGGLPTPPPQTLAIMFGGREFTTIDAPAMAIFACPHSLNSMPWTGPGLSADQQQVLRQRDAARCSAQAEAFEKGNPADPVVRIPHASHYVFRSNPDVVERAMRDFLEKLPAR